MSIGSKIREARELAGMDGKELGRLLGHNQGVYVSKLERGEVPNPGIDTVQAIAGILNQPISFFVDEASGSGAAA